MLPPYMEERQKIELENLEEYTKNRYMNALRVRDLAKRYLQEAKDSMLDRQHKNATSREINAGDTVYLKAGKPIHHSNKFTPLWSGPHVVQQRISNNRFMLKCRATGKLFTAHVDNFRITKAPFIVNNDVNEQDSVKRPENHVVIPRNSRNTGSNDIDTSVPNPHGNSRYTGRDNRFERITRSKSNARTLTNDTREFAFHETDEDDDDWVYRRMQNSQKEGSGNNNNDIIIRGNAVNNEISQHNDSKSNNDIVRNRNSFANEVLHNEISIRQGPDHVLNDQNNDSRTIREDPARHGRRESNDRSYKPYSKSYTNFRTEPVMTRSATRAEAQRKLETIEERKENEGVRLRSILKDDIRTSTPTKKNKSVSFNLPYSPIGIPKLMDATVR